MTPAPRTLTLLDGDGTLRAVPLDAARPFPRPTAPLRARTVYAAAHVVPRTAADNTPGAPADLDWDRTLDVRRTIWSWGLGVADAMDTAQRNMGLDPAATRELIRRSADAAREALADPAIGSLFEEGAQVSDLVVAGVNTDSRADEQLDLDEIVEAYVEQLRETEATGAGVVLMASRHLARAARDAADYEDVYARVLDRATEPVVLHWLGTAFDPSLAGYFGSEDVGEASATLLRIIGRNPSAVRGLKMSLLDAPAEISVRDRLPAGVRMLTGDDFHFAGLIVGEDAPGAARGSGFSHALLGAFAATAPAASAAITALDEGDPARALAILEGAEQLACHVFSAPTFHYKTGIAFLSWLNGHQDAFAMVGGLHSARSLPHLSRTVELAAATGNLEDPALAATRWHALLRLQGYDIPEDQ